MRVSGLENVSVTGFQLTRRHVRVTSDVFWGVFSHKPRLRFA